MKTVWWRGNLLFRLLSLSLGMMPAAIRVDCLFGLPRLVISLALEERGKSRLLQAEVILPKMQVGKLASSFRRSRRRWRAGSVGKGERLLTGCGRSPESNVRADALHVASSEDEISRSVWGSCSALLIRLHVVEGQVPVGRRVT
jgi:hypothetical protein